MDTAEGGVGWLGGWHPTPTYNTSSSLLIDTPQQNKIDLTLVEWRIPLSNSLNRWVIERSLTFFSLFCLHWPWQTWLGCWGQLLWWRLNINIRLDRMRREYRGIVLTSELGYESLWLEQLHSRFWWMVENIFLLREAGTMLFGVNIREVDRMSLSPDKLSLYTRLDLRVDFPTGPSANISW